MTASHIRIWLITGDPGVGKTTCISSIINTIKSEGYIIGGVISRETREKGERTGFEMIDLATEERFTLASTSLDAGPKLGRYRVNLRGLAEIGVAALLSSPDQADLTVCDEIGPMELLSPEFRRAVESVIRRGRPVLAVIHKRLGDPLLVNLKTGEYTTLFEVTLENRDDLPDKVAADILNVMRSPG
jgi:nucleoside-triphosphatase